MNGRDLLQLGLFLVIVLCLAKPLGLHFVNVLDPRRATCLDRLFKPLEGLFYRLSGIDPHLEQTWQQYLFALLHFSALCVLFCASVLALQRFLPLNPQKFAAPSWHLNFNTSISFMTNTNWQNYGGESTLSYFAQMAALGVQNFTSAAVGIAAGATLVRGLVRREAKTIGNFWADLIRISLYVLFPLALISAVFFLSQGIPQNFHSYAKATTMEGSKQTIVQGPIASQEAIKILGTNGGGFTNANSAHPYENPTPLSNFFQLILIFLISASLIYYFGYEVNNVNHAWCLLGALLSVFVIGVIMTAHYEYAGNPEWAKEGIVGGNWEGKEVRFGIFNSALYACTTTVTSCGAVNCMHDSLTPMGGFIPLLNMQLSETIIGGVGAGLYSILLFIFLAIFIAGLIIGRTPEYFGKKIEAFDMKMTMLANLSYVLIVLTFTSIAVVSKWGLAGLGNSGPHGFSEILYAFSSCGANNGSAFAGLSGNTAPYNVAMAIAMLLGRFLFMAPVIAIAGSLAAKKFHPPTAGSFPVSSVVFISLFIMVLLLLGVLNFLPALTMGPIVEHFFMKSGALFP